MSELAASLRLLNAIEFQGDPLHPDIPVPGYLRREACSCDPAARHSLRCEATPLFTELVYETAERPGYSDPFFDMWAMDLLYPWRWVCLGDGNQHRGGLVNGPEHWCVGLKRMVGPGG